MGTGGDLRKVRPKKVTRILVVGHSWGVGIFGGIGEGTFGGEKDKELIERAAEKRGREIEERTGVPVEIEAVVKVGSGIEWAEARLARRDLSRYDAVIIFTGSNDISSKSPQSLARRYRGIYDLLTSGGVKKVLMFNMPPLRTQSRRVDEFNRLTRTGKHRIPRGSVIDVFGKLIDDPRAIRHGHRLHPYSYRPVRELFVGRVVDVIGRRTTRKKRKPDAVAYH